MTLESTCLEAIKLDEKSTPFEWEENAIAYMNHACANHATLARACLVMREALKDISTGKNQSDIGMPPESIGWRMMRTAQMANAKVAALFENGK